VARTKGDATEVRDQSAAALGSFRGKARATVPGLQKLLNDVDPHVRWQATNSLLKIAPEVLQGKAQAEGAQTQ
jgi:HEAT repeat protein